MRSIHKHYSEAKYTRDEKRWCCGRKAARIASKRFNKAARKAAKLRLLNFC